jgi:hypothetical protein
MIKYYTDINVCNTTYFIPEDNNTGVECNYCIEDLEQILGTCRNNNQSVTWQDNNFITCCYLTDILDDCDILYSPYNETSYQTCNATTLACQENLTTDFTCQYDQAPILSNKINVECEMPSNMTYCCVVNILQNGTLLQTNPEYKKSTNALVSWKVGEEELRTCFEPSSRLLNAFYTSKNVRTETPFTMEVRCTTNNGSTIKSQYCITPIYDNPDWLVNRTAWASKNAGYLIVLAFITVLVAMIIGGLRRRALGR